MIGPQVTTRTRLGWLAVVGLLLLLLGPARGVVAQPAPDRPQPPWEQTDDALAEEGWEFQTGDIRPGSAPAGAIALTLGTLLHGIGHVYVGDFESASRLAAIEVISLVLWSMGRNEDTPTRAVSGDILRVIGGGLFVTSWLADVIGALKGRSIPLPTNQAEPRGLWIEALYSGLTPSTLAYAGNLQARVPLRLRHVVLVPELSLQPTLGYRRGAVDAGFRTFALDDRLAFWAGGVGIYEETELEGLLSTRDALGAYVRADVDLAVLLEHLEHMVWTVRVDAMANRYGFEDGRDPLRWRSLHWQTPAMTQLSFNMGRMVSLTWGYALRNDTQVGAGTTGGYMYEVLRFVPRGRFGIEMGAEQGRYARLWVGLRWQLSGSSDTALVAQ